MSLMESSMQAASFPATTLSCVTEQVAAGVELGERCGEVLSPEHRMSSADDVCHDVVF